MAADACAHGTTIGVGGWVRFPGQPVPWFAEQFDVKDFRGLDIPVRDSVKADIVAFELLAQIGLILCYASACRGGCMSIRLTSLSDNSGAEAAINEMFAVVQPLALFVQRLTLVSWEHAIQLDTSRVAGTKNAEADLLSRWDGVSDLSQECGVWRIGLGALCFVFGIHCVDITEGWWLEYRLLEPCGSHRP